MTTTDSTPDPIEQFIHDYLLFLDGDREQPSLHDLDEKDQAEATARVRLLDAARTAGAEVPTGALDRIAQRFGFDRSGTRISISGTKLKRVRQQAGLNLKDMAAAATAAGTPVRTAELLNIENSDRTQLDQALVTALVAILGSSVPELEDDFADETTVVRQFLASDRFDELILDWAAEHGRDEAEIRDVVQDRVLASKYRAHEVTEDQLVDLVRAILQSLEP